MRLSKLVVVGMAGGLAAWPLRAAVAAPTVQIELPLQRTAYQDNELIDVAVVRSDVTAMPASDLMLTLTGSDGGQPNGSKLSFDFPLSSVPLLDGKAVATEHLRLNGWLLKPGHYTIDVTADDTKASAEIDVHSHVRKSSFRIGMWGGRAQGADIQVEGEDGLGYNLILGANEDQSPDIRAGIDFMRVCTMSGGHQMDLRMECDWSDPYVTRGGTQRVEAAALVGRTKPNVLGVHFYDEPGLTWQSDPETKEFTPHGIPSQLRSYKAAFDKDVPDYKKLDAKDPQNVADWSQWAKWKLGFMDAAWQDAQYGVEDVRPDFLSATQSQYGWTAFTDGYYYNVVRGMPIISGHGGYDDIGPGYFTPSLFLEYARARAASKPNWYLPAWYGATPNDRMRLEQYMSFSTGIQGLMTPPEMDPTHPERVLAGESIIESNKTMARLGTIFTTMHPDRPKFAILYSLSQAIHDQTLDPHSNNYSHGLVHGVNLFYTYLATKMIQQPFTTVVDEDIVDGTLANNCTAVMLPGISYLDPKVVTALKAFQAGGGTVLVSGEAPIGLPGAINLGPTPKLPDQAAFDKLMAAKTYDQLGPYRTVAKQEQAVQPLAKALKAALDGARVTPAFQCDNPNIAANRQVSGDIEYLFAMNTTPDPKPITDNRLLPASATIGLPTMGRTIYDALIGGPASEFSIGKGFGNAQERFGPGQMKVWALTSRPIGGVKVGKPHLHRDYTSESNPLSVDISASLLDNEGRVLSGSAPLEIRLLDPLGGVRYDLYRATTDGVYTDSLPLALNDPAGYWNVEVRDLLANTSNKADFQLMTSNNAGAAGGSVSRAITFGNDRRHVFQFFREHQDVTFVVGSSEFDNAQAKRLADILKPWNVQAKIVNAADIKSRTLTADEARTWVGLGFAGAGQIKPGGDNAPLLVGFDIRGAAVLLGNAQDNPLIKFIQDNGMLPYKPAKDDFPGRDRGMVAWQVGGLGHIQESLTLIAYDAAGMAEAVGSTYEAAAGMDPVTPVETALQTSLTPVTVETNIPMAPVAWWTMLGDRAISIHTDGGHLVVTTLDGSANSLDATGKLTKRDNATVLSTFTAAPAGTTIPATPAAVVPDALAKSVWADHRVKRVATANGLTAIGYWGGGLQVFDAAGKLKSQQTLENDITDVAWLGDVLVVGLADGRVIGLKS